MSNIPLSVGEAYASIVAAIFAASTFLLGIVAGSRVMLRRRSNRLRVERYLKSEREQDADKGQRSVLHIATELGLLEAQVIEAAFVSNRVARWTKTDELGVATRMLLSYDPERRSEQNRFQ